MNMVFFEPKYCIHGSETIFIDFDSLIFFSGLIVIDLDGADGAVRLESK